MKQPYLFILLLLALLSSPFLALAQTSYTVTTTTDDGTGQAGTLSAAINLANANPGADIITFSVSSVALTGALPSITESLTIQGFNALCPATSFGGTTIQRASTAPLFRIFTVETNTTVSFQDLILENGVAPDVSGGGIRANGNAQLLLNRCLIQNCRSGYLGGAIFAQGQLDVNNCVIINNTAFGDGGIFINTTSLTLNRIRNSTIARNTATNVNSGGMTIINGDFLIENTTFSDNADAGSQATGSALSIGSLSVRLVHVTIKTDNRSRPAIQSAATTGQVTASELTNCLVVAPLFLSGLINSGGGNVLSSAVNAGAEFTAQSSDRINVGTTAIDLQPLADNGGCTLSHALGCASVAINAGVSTSLGTDQRGTARFGSAPDAGSFESQLVGLTPSVFTNNTPGGLVVQVSGGASYERIKSVYRINGYEIRQTEQNQTGYFLIPQPGPYAITVIGANGCRAVVTGTVP